ncbi:MAG: hypothetical protein LBT46_10240 [Planctomycetaceae bacterium]|nr:hypothetical protein [Planctomycetaceae bacterium]
MKIFCNVLVLANTCYQPVRRPVPFSSLSFGIKAKVRRPEVLQIYRGVFFQKRIIR